MKKILLSACVILVASTTFAQSRMAELPRETALKNKANISPTIVSSTSASVAPFFTNDFSNANDWTINPSSNGQDWVIGTTAPAGSFSAGMGAIVSTTAANGFAMYDSDLIGNAAGGQDATITYNGTVDCSLYSFVNINFESSHRKFNDSVFVEISNDAWLTFERFEVHALQALNASSDNPEFVSVNISTVAGNQSSVSFRFHYEGEWDYAWMVDDVNFTETPDNLMGIESAVTGGYWVDYQNYSASGLNSMIGLDYSIIPVDQAAVRPFSCEAVIKNIGISSQSAVLKYDVTGTMAYSGSSVATVLASSDLVTVAATPTFSPGVGTYAIEMWAEADSAAAGVVTTLSDIETRNVEVSQYLYGKDLGDTELAGSRAIGGPDDQNQITTRFEIYANADLYSLRVFITDQSVVGAKIYAVIYEADTTASNGLFPLVESDDYTLTAQDLGNWVDVPFTNSISLFAGYAYEFGIGGYQHPIDSSRVGVTANLSLYNGEHSSFDVTGLSTQSAGNPTWYYITSTPMVRMNFDPSTISSVSDIKQSIFNVYPNPSNGVFVIELAAIEKYDVTVNNVLGQTVLSATTNGMSTTIDLSNFDKGVYTIELRNANVTYTEKVIVE